MKKYGKGVWVQLTPESQEKINAEMKRRMSLSPEEHAQEMVDSIRRGFKLLDEAFTQMIQDENVNYINNL